MKLKYYIVEYVDYLPNDRGFPSTEMDDRTFRRRRFSSKKEAKQFIRQYLTQDPAYTGMWLAKINLHIVKEKIEVIAFNTLGYKNGTVPHAFSPREEF